MRVLLGENENTPTRALIVVSHVVSTNGIMLGTKNEVVLSAQLSTVLVSRTRKLLRKRPPEAKT